MAQLDGAMDRSVLVERPMFTPKQYRAKAAQYTQLLKTTRSPAETREFRKLEQSYITLAENDEWLAENPEKTHGQSVPDNWYDDVILAQAKEAHSRLPWDVRHNAVD